MPQPPLSAGQIEFFKTHGYLIIESMIEPVYIDAWRRDLWAHVGGEVQRPETWGEQTFTLNDFSFSPTTTLLSQHPKVAAVIDQLGGGAFTGGGGSPLIKWPDGRTVWRPPADGHVDAYGPGGWSPFMIAATTYCYDVEYGGGAFTYWPDSHRSTHEYFLEHPEQVDGSFYQLPDFSWAIFSDRSPQGPTPFVARAGSVTFWHAYLCHTVSMNVRNVPRFGIFARWAHRDQQRFKYEIPQNLWKYWAV